jgi:hypothetical protein
MNWRETATFPPGPRPADEEMDVIVRAIPADQRVLMVTTVNRFDYNPSPDIRGPVVVLTDKALHFAKRRRPAKMKPDWTYKLEDFEELVYGPFQGVGPAWCVRFKIVEYGIWHFGMLYFNGPDRAEPIYQELHKAVRELRAPGTLFKTHVIEKSAASIECVMRYPF